MNRGFARAVACGVFLLFLGGPAGAGDPLPSKITTYAPPLYGPPPAPRAAPLAVLTGAVNDAGADVTTYDTQYGTSIAAVGGTRLVTAYGDDGSLAAGFYQHTGFATSLNGGAAWQDGGTLPLLPGHTRGLQPPVLAADPAAGVVYSASANGGDPGISVNRSKDGGRTWLPFDVDGIGQNFSGLSADHAWIAADRFDGPGRGTVYVCFTAGPHVFVTRSTDQGASFGPAGGFDLGAVAASSCTVTVGPTHDVYVFYVIQDGAATQLAMRRSVDHGVNFAPAVVVRTLLAPATGGVLPLNGGVPNRQTPQVAINPDPKKPWLYLAYHDSAAATTGADNGDIYLVRSTNFGATWSAPEAVDAGARDQFNPVAGFASPGKLMVAYTSRTLDADNIAMQRQARIGRLAATGAIVWNAPFQLGPMAPQLADINSPGWAIGYGPWDGLAALAGKWVTTWTDARSGDAFNFRQADVRFAAIATPQPANLGVTLAGSAANALPLEKRRVRLHITSAGGVAADAFVSLAGSKGLAITPVGVQRCTVNGQFVGCALGRIGLTARDIDFDVMPDAAAGLRTLQAVVSTSSTDTNQTNNTASLTFNVTSGSTAPGSYSTGDLAVAIVDNSTIDVPLAVPDNGLVAEVGVGVRLNHTFDSDLTLQLVSPGGISVPLVARRGGSQGNFGGGATNCSGLPAAFYDTAYMPAAAAVPPFIGSIVPEMPLSSLLGTNVHGTWKLRITDSAIYDVGTLYCFKMTIVRQP